MSGHALYYPRLQPPSVEWLKATLLWFHTVKRITPWERTPSDSPDILAFTQQQGGRAPMLQPAEIFGRRSSDAQRALAGRLLVDACDRRFRERFSRSSAEAGAGTPFFIFHAKLHHELKDALIRADLVWDENRDRPDLFAPYVVVHPLLGQAVMATIATSCAIAENLHLVADPRDGPLHDVLVERRQQDVYDVWLRDEGRTNVPFPPRAATDHEIFEVLIELACDLAALDAQTLAELPRKPLKRLAAAMAEAANEVGRMDPGPRRRERLEDAASDALARWSAERANLGTFWKRFFGQGAATAAGGGLARIVERVSTGGIVGGLVAGTTGAVLGAIPGLAIGVVARAVEVAGATAEDARKGPYRYLTVLEQHGAIFRSDLRATARERELAGAPL